MLLGRGLCEGSIRRTEESYRRYVCVCVCVCVCLCRARVCDCKVQKSPHRLLEMLRLRKKERKKERKI